MLTGLTPLLLIGLAGDDKEPFVPTVKFAIVLLD